MCSFTRRPSGASAVDAASRRSDVVVAVHEGHAVDDKSIGMGQKILTPLRFCARHPAIAVVAAEEQRPPIRVHKRQDDHIQFGGFLLHLDHPRTSERPFADLHGVDAVREHRRDPGLAIEAATRARDQPFTCFDAPRANAPVLLEALVQKRVELPRPVARRLLHGHPLDFGFGQSGPTPWYGVRRVAA